MPTLTYVMSKRLIGSYSRRARKMLRLYCAVAVFAVLPGSSEVLAQASGNTAYRECVSYDANAQYLGDFCDEAINSGRLTRKELSIAWSMRGYHLQTRKRHRAAIRSLTKALSFNPSDAISYYYRGWSFRELGNLEGALADFKYAYFLEPHPDHYKAVADTERDMVRRGYKRR